AGDGRTTSICDSITSTVTAGSEEESLSDDDNDEDNGDDSDTASAPSPNPLRTEEGDVDLVPGQRGAMPGEPETRDGPGLAPPPAVLSEENKQLSTSQGSLRSIDNDSSATMSADEGPPGSLGIHGGGGGGAIAGHPSGLHGIPPPSMGVYGQPHHIQELSQRHTPPSVNIGPGSRGNPPHTSLAAPFTRPGSGPGIPSSQAAVRASPLGAMGRPPSGEVPVIREAAMSVFRQMPQPGMSVDYQGMVPYSSHLVPGEQGRPASHHLEPLRSSPRPSSAHSAHSDTSSGIGQQSGSPRVKDLINSYIEKNICEQPLPSQSPQDRRGPMVDPGRSRGPTPQDLRKERPLPHMGDPRAGIPGPGGMGYPPTSIGASRDMDLPQDILPRRPDPLDKGPHGYKGDPRDFDPQHRSRPDSYQRSTAEPPRQMAAPPPAHSHHHSGVSASHSGAQDLGKPPGHRPDSRNKSPSMYQVDSRSISPSVRGGQSSSSPYPHGLDPSRYSPAARIPGPPPLITSGGSGQQRASPKQARSPPLSGGPPPPHMMIRGSITQGTPASHTGPPPHGHPMAGMVRQPAPPPQQGSITKGTPMRGPDGSPRMPMDPRGGGPPHPSVYEGAGGQYRHSQQQQVMYGKQQQGGPQYGQGSLYSAQYPSEQNPPYSSKATIMSDYLTAQQMPRGQKCDREEGLSPRGGGRDNLHPSPGPSHPSGPGPRQPQPGVDPRMMPMGGQGMVYMGKGRDDKPQPTGWPQGVRGMPGQAMPNPMGLGPMSTQRPSIVAGTGRMPPLPHHPEHKPEVQSAMADSTSMQQQHQRGQLSPRQADSSGRLMNLLGVPSDPGQPRRLSPGLRGPYKADSPYEKVTSASVSRTAQWEQQMKQRQYEPSLAEQQNRQEQERRLAEARATSVAQAHPSQAADPRGYPGPRGDGRDPRDLRDPFPGEMRVDTRRLEMSAAQMEEQRQQQQQQHQLEVGGQRPLTDSNYVRKQLGDSGSAVLLSAFQRDNVSSTGQVCRPPAPNQPGVGLSQSGRAIPTDKLINAIIIHQINSTAPEERPEPGKPSLRQGTPGSSESVVSSQSDLRQSSQRYFDPPMLDSRQRQRMEYEQQQQQRRQELEYQHRQQEGEHRREAEQHRREIEARKSEAERRELESNAEQRRLDMEHKQRQDMAYRQQQMQHHYHNPKMRLMVQGEQRQQQNPRELTEQEMEHMHARQQEMEARARAPESNIQDSISKDQQIRSGPSSSDAEARPVHSSPMAGTKSSSPAAGSGPAPSHSLPGGKKLATTSSSASDSSNVMTFGATIDAIIINDYSNPKPSGSDGSSLGDGEAGGDKGPTSILSRIQDSTSSASSSRDHREMVDASHSRSSPAASEAGLVGSTSDSRPRSLSVPTSQGPSVNWKKWDGIGERPSHGPAGSLASVDSSVPSSSSSGAKSGHLSGELDQSRSPRSHQSLPEAAYPPGGKLLSCDSFPSFFKAVYFKVF
ncbi:nuclear receptor corepressor 1, partial [Plakobranchus ocellatus]